MKQLLAIIFSITSTFLFAQLEVEVEEQVPEAMHFAVVEIIPRAKSCEEVEDSKKVRECFQQYVLNHVVSNFKFSKSAQKRGVEGRCYVNFVIEKDASVSNVEIIRSISSGYEGESEKIRKAAKELDDEALRVISSLEFAEPAYQKGKAVRMSFTVPINAYLR